MISRVTAASLPHSVHCLSLFVVILLFPCLCSLLWPHQTVWIHRFFLASLWCSLLAPPSALTCNRLLAALQACHSTHRKTTDPSPHEASLMSSGVPTEATAVATAAAATTTWTAATVAGTEAHDCSGLDGDQTTDSTEERSCTAEADSFLQQEIIGHVFCGHFCHLVCSIHDVREGSCAMCTVAGEEVAHVSLQRQRGALPSLAAAGSDEAMRTTALVTCYRMRMTNTVRSNLVSENFDLLNHLYSNLFCWNVQIFKIIRPYCETTRREGYHTCGRSDTCKCTLLLNEAKRVGS